MATILSRRGDPGPRGPWDTGVKLRSRKRTKGGREERSTYPPPSLSCKHGERREAFGRGSVRVGAGVVVWVGVVILVLGVIVRVVLGVVITVVVVLVLAPILVPAPACAFATVPIPVEVKLEEPAAVDPETTIKKLAAVAQTRLQRAVPQRIIGPLSKILNRHPSIPLQPRTISTPRSRMRKGLSRHRPSLAPSSKKKNPRGQPSPTKVRVPEEASERKEEKRDRDVIAPHTWQPPPKEHPVRIAGLHTRRHKSRVYTTHLER
ncbi:hypothetical protein DFP72DRAFT_1152270 [Ephemerocybe angulata]|uniref:Uncharacterized protein n=1 Tax=Ephemerocybe angulata TaxID=980116 RepID=A0A8H6HGV9_9AGAR|nr:hypothetical protein DFP72DRAFT_1152270 [Tulosesus angulatus]